MVVIFIIVTGFLYLMSWFLTVGSGRGSPSCYKCCLLRVILMLFIKNAVCASCSMFLGGCQYKLCKPKMSNKVGECCITTKQASFLQVFLELNTHSIMCFVNIQEGYLECHLFECGTWNVNGYYFFFFFKKRLLLSCHFRKQHFNTWILVLFTFIIHFNKLVVLIHFQDACHLSLPAFPLRWYAATH